MSCITPCAPRLEITFGLKRDSRIAIAATRFGSTRYVFAASVMTEARYCGTGSGKAEAARGGGSAANEGAARDITASASTTMNGTIFCASEPTLTTALVETATMDETTAAPSQD